MRKIVSIDGGGMFGIVPAEVCTALEDELGRPLSEVFDLIVGTSTGGVLALALALGIPATTARDLYLTRGSDIFGKPRPRWRQAIHTKYDDDGLKEVLQEELGVQAYMKDCRTRVMVTARNLTRQTNTFIKSWDHPMLACWMAAQATGSAPTFLPAVELGGEYYVDGGLFGADPAPFAYVEALKLWPDEELTLLSLGTGETPPTPFNPKDRGKGLLYWGPHIAGEFLDGQADTAEHMMGVLIPPIPSTMHYSRYYRLNPALTGSKHMDETDTSVLIRAQDAAADAVQHWAQWDGLIHDLAA